MRVRLDNMIEQLLKDIKIHQDDPEFLSRTCIELAGLLYTHNTQMAEAELEEKKEVVELINKLDGIETKKMSVAEAEKRAVVLTENKYGILKAQNEAIIEIINSIKVRLKVLTWERKDANQAPF